MPEPSLNSEPAGRRFLTCWTIIWIAAWVGLFGIMHTRVPAGMRLPLKHGDLMIHFCAYFTLALVGVRSAFSRHVRLTPRWLVKWIVIYTIYAVFDELSQELVHRHASVWDWAADVAGAAAALGVACVNRPVDSDADSSSGWHDQGPP